jgi:hypothetical protein
MWPLLSFAAAGVGAAGKLYEGFAKSDAGRLSAGIARDNADLLDRQGEIAKESAGLSLTKGAWDASQVARALQTTQAGNVSHFAGRNIDPSSGSPLLMQGFSAAQGATDMALAAAKGEIGYAEGLTRSSGIFGQAASQQWKAAQDEQAATTARISGLFGAATTLLSAGAAPWAGIGGLTAASPVGVGDYSMPRIGNFWEYS